MHCIATAGTTLNCSAAAPTCCLAGCLLQGGGREAVPQEWGAGGVGAAGPGPTARLRGRQVCNRQWYYCSGTAVVLLFVLRCDLALLPCVSLAAEHALPEAPLQAC